MSYGSAAASGLSKPQVHKFAESTAAQLGLVPGGDLNDLVSRIGGQVIVEDTLLTDPEQTGSLYVEEPGRFKIMVPSHTSPERDRFTIAHELGHYVLHYLLPKQKNPDHPDRMMAFRKGSDRLEWEANWFAAAFLMPSAPFRGVYQENLGSLRAVASFFGVSQAAAEVRARGLNLLG